MPINVSKQFIRSLVKELVDHETTATDKKTSTKPFTKKIGHVEFKHYRQSGTVDLYVGYSEEEDMHESFASLCKFTDDRIGILLKDNGNLFANIDLMPVVYGALAHELGHYINDDLKEKTDKENFLLRAVDVNIDKQISTFESEGHKNYIKTIITSVLKDGVIKNELAADIVAIELVGLPALLMAKMYDDIDAINLTVLIEKRNRINRLMTLVKNNTIEHKNDSEVAIIFDPVDSSN